MVGPIDEAYLSWLRQRPCRAGFAKSSCGVVVEAHHTTGRGMGGSRRDDRDAVSLCTIHHRQFHDTGRLYPFDPEHTKWALYEAAHQQLKLYLDEMKRRGDYISATTPEEAF